MIGYRFRQIIPDGPEGTFRMKRRWTLPEADEPVPVGADEARRWPIHTRHRGVSQRRVGGQSGYLPPQTHRPLPGRFPLLLLLLLAVRGLQKHRHLTVLLLILPTVAAYHAPVQGGVRTAGGDRGVVKGRGVLRVSLAVIEAGAPLRPLQLVRAFPGALTWVAVLSPPGGVWSEVGAARLCTVTGRLVGARPSSSTFLPPHWAAGPALQTQRVAAVHAVSEGDSRLVVSEGTREEVCQKRQQIRCQQCLSQREKLDKHFFWLSCWLFLCQQRATLTSLAQRWTPHCPCVFRWFAGPLCSSLQNIHWHQRSWYICKEIIHFRFKQWFCAALIRNTQTPNIKRTLRRWFI